MTTAAVRLFMALVVAGVAVVESTAQAALLPKKASETLDVQSTSYLSASCGFSNMYAFDRKVVGSTVVPFTIPNKKVFVVTGFDWSVRGGLPNQTRTAWLFRNIGGGVNGPSAQSSATADSTGKAGGSVIFPTGLVVKPPAILCIQLEDASASEDVTGVVHGFLASDK